MSAIAEIVRPMKSIASRMDAFNEEERIGLERIGWVLVKRWRIVELDVATFAGRDPTVQERAA